MCHCHVGIRVSTHSIRYRILKDGSEWECLGMGGVSTHSIRYRILKAKLLTQVLYHDQGFNPFDPIQDTERSNLYRQQLLAREFQPIRSDTGY